MTTGFPGIGNPAGGQPRDIRDYGSFAANLPPMTMGTHAIPSAPHSKLPHAAWIPFFGVGNTNVYHDPYDSYDQEIRNFPDAYRAPGGREAGMYPNAFLDKLVINQISRSQQYLITEVLPWQVNTGQMVVSWNEWRFNQHMLDRTPEQSVSRLLTSNQKSFKAGLVRYGIALMLEHGFMKTAKGRKNYEMNIQQIVNATVMTLMKGAWVALLHVDHRADESDNLPNNRLDSKTEAERIIQRELDYFHIAAKGPNAFYQLLEAERERFLERTGENPDYCIVGRGMLKYANGLRQHEFYFPMTGYKISEVKNKERDRKMGMVIREAPTFNLGGEHKNIAPAEQDKTTTNFIKWVYAGGCDPKEFSTANILNTYTYNYDTNKEVLIEFSRALWCTGWFKKTESGDVEMDSDMALGSYNNGHFGAKADLIKKDGRPSSTYMLSSLGKKALARFQTWGKYLKHCGRREAFVAGVNRDSETREAFLATFSEERKAAPLPAKQRTYLGRRQQEINVFVREIRDRMNKARGAQGGAAPPPAAAAASVQSSEETRELVLEPQIQNPVFVQQSEEKSTDQKDKAVVPNSLRSRLAVLYKLGYEGVLDAIYHNNVANAPEPPGVRMTEEQFVFLMEATIKTYQVNRSQKDPKMRASAETELAAYLLNLQEMPFTDPLTKPKLFTNAVAMVQHIQTKGIELAAIAAQLREEYGEVLRGLPRANYDEFLLNRADNDRADETEGLVGNLDEIPQTLDSDIGGILDSLPIEEAEICFFAANHNLVPPVEVVGWRNIEWRVSPMVMLKAYGRAGITWQGEHSFELGDDPVRKVHFGHFTLYATSVVTDANLVQHAHAVMCHRYLNGGGTELWDFNLPRHAAAFRRGQKIASILCMGVIPGDTRLYSAKMMDMTGFLHPQFGELRSLQGNDPLPREAPLYAEKLSLHHAPNALTLFPFLERRPYYQTLGFQAYQKNMGKNMGKGKWGEAATLNQGHEGPDFGYEGSIKAFNGETMYLERPNWHPLSMRQNTVSSGLSVSSSPYTF